MSLLFKILGPEGEPIHGGVGGAWPLPARGRKGRWIEVEDEPKVCRRGLHLVSDPLRWWRKESRLFVAEPDLRAGFSSDGSEKAAFKRVRLVEEVTPEWPLLGMFDRVRAYLAAQGRMRANLADANLAGAYLTRANLSDANLAFANLARAHLTRANLMGANLTDANLARAYLTDANLMGANLMGADLTGANLTDANLSDANLAFANLARAHLTRANLMGANLTGADLTGANLTDANLMGANLAFANLARANLTGAYRPENPPAGWRPNADGRLERVA